MVVGGSIVASLITPDLTRYYTSGRQVLMMTLLTIVAGEYVINGMAVYLSFILQTSDIVTIISQFTGGLGLIAVVLSTLRINDINLYSSALGIINAIEAFTGFKASYVVVTLFIGALGTLLSVLGILDRFVDFLNLLGVLFPPVIGIMLLDYFILRTDRSVLDASRAADALPEESQTDSTGWRAIAASLAGALVGYFFTAGVPAINSIIAGGAAYLLLKKVARGA